MARKLIGLEALRFTAAFGVVVWHYGHFGFGTDFYESTANLPLYNVFSIFYAYGDAGVQQFWCISGFIFAWRYGVSIRENRISFTRFMILRFSRLYPLQFTTLLVLAGMQMVYLRGHGQYFVYHVNDLKHSLLNLFFAQYWGFQDGRSFNGPSWSISLEILVYILFFALSRLIRPDWRSATGIMAGLLVLGFMIHAAFGMIPEAIFGAVFFYAGVITCHIYVMVINSHAPRIMIVLLLAAAILAMSIGIHGGFLKLGWTGFRIFPAIVLFPAVVLIFQLAIPDTYPRVNSVLTSFGDLTYASYMVHFPLQLAIVLSIDAVGIPMRSVFHEDWFFLTYVLSVFVLARIVFLGFERPAQNALRYALLNRSTTVRSRTE